MSLATSLPELLILVKGDELRHEGRISARIYNVERHVIDIDKV